MLNAALKTAIKREAEANAKDLADRKRADLEKAQTLLPEAAAMAARIDEGPVFRPVNKAGVVGATALAGGEVPRILKRLAKRAGLDSATIFGHSARVGMGVAKPWGRYAASWMAC